MNLSSFFWGEGLVFLLHRISFSQFEKKLQRMSHDSKTHASVDGGSRSVVVEAV